MNNMTFLHQLDFINQQWNKSAPKQHYDFWEKNVAILAPNVLTCPEIFYFVVYLTSILGYQKIDEKTLYGKADKALIDNAKKKILKLHTQALGDDLDSICEMAKAQAFFRWFTHSDLTIIANKLNGLVATLRNDVDTKHRKTHLRRLP